LITGGSSGIGQAMVSAFSKAGYNVTFTFRSGKQKAETIIAELPERNVKALKWDADDKQSSLQLIEAFPEPDIIINNAGLGSATVKNVSDDVFEQDRLLLQVNAIAPLWLIRGYLPRLKEKGGTIINISSVGGGINQFPGFNIADGMSKAAVSYLTRHLAAELSHDPVHVFAICPGATETPMFGASTLDHLSPEKRSELLAKLPGGRLISPDEIASIALFLCTDAAQVLRGTVLDASLGLGVNPGLLQK